jgi:uncharacterized Zn finger protein (UPF0148 family)
MAELRVELTCPGCQNTFLRAVDEQGQILECPSCGGWVDVPEIGRPPSKAEVEEEANRRFSAEYDRQLSENARQIERSKKLIEWQEQQNAQFDKLFARADTVLAKWEQLALRAVGLIEGLELGRPQ